MIRMTLDFNEADFPAVSGEDAARFFAIEMLKNAGFAGAVAERIEVKTPDSAYSAKVSECN